MSGPKRVAIYGGSFDPPHNGHRKLVEFFWENYPDTYKLCIVPNRISPFKRTKYFQPEDSLELARINFSSIQPEKTEVLDLEIQRPTASYTYETILSVKMLYPKVAIDLIIGEDQLLELPHWKEYGIILEEVDRYLVFRRSTESPATIPVPPSLLPANLEILDNPLWEESSSAWRHWPTPIGIYGPVFAKMQEIYDKRFSQSVIQDWKTLVKREVSDTRYEHALRVAHIGKELASQFGYPFPAKAELAGIVHDITKQRSREEHVEIFNKYGFSDYIQLPNPAYHAYSARYFLMELGLDDKDILDAVESHTLGKPNMSFLESIVYSSDFFGSDFMQRSPKKEEWLSEISRNLQFGLFLKSKSTIEHLLEKNQPIHSYTMQVYNYSLELLSQE